MQRRLRAILAALVSVGLLAAVAVRVDLSGALALARQVRPGPLLLAVLLGPLQIGLSAVRWRMVAGRLDAPIPRCRAVEEYALGTLLNMVLPGGVVGDAVRTWRAHRRLAVPGAVAIQATLIERGLGQGVLVLIALAALLTWPSDLSRPAGALPLVLLVVAVMAGLAVSPGDLGTKIRRVLRRDALAHLLLSGAIVGSYLAGFALCALALDADPVVALRTVFPLLLLIMAVPISVGGLGVREAGAVALLPRLGWSGEAALAVAGLYGLSALLGALPGALVLARSEAA